MENRGIYVQNSTVNAGSMAAGDNANAMTVQVAGIAELRTSLANLARTVDDPSVESSAPDLAGARTAVADARAEADKDVPDPSRLRQLLDRVRSGAGTVSAVAAAVTAVEGVLQAVL